MDRVEQAGVDGGDRWGGDGRGGDQPAWQEDPPIVDVTAAARNRSWYAAALLGAGLLTAVLLVGALVLAVISGSDRATLTLVVQDSTTTENPLPPNMELMVGGERQVPIWSGDEATIEVPGAFDDTDQVTVTIGVPEPVELAVQRSGAGASGATRAYLQITDSSLSLSGGPTTPPANPVQEAQRAEAERLRAEATAVRVERERVGAVLWDAVTRSERADAAYQRIWDGRELAPYDEIYDVIHGQVLPEVDGAIGLVSSTTSVDPDGQRAIDAARGCLVALRDAYERDATFNESLTEAANLAEQQAAFDRTNQPCSEWGSLAASLGA